MVLRQWLQILMLSRFQNCLQELYTMVGFVTDAISPIATSPGVSASSLGQSFIMLFFVFKLQVPVYLYHETAGRYTPNVLGDRAHFRQLFEIPIRRDQVC